MSFVRDAVIVCEALRGAEPDLQAGRAASQTSPVHRGQKDSIGTSSTNLAERMQQADAAARNAGHNQSVVASHDWKGEQAVAPQTQIELRVHSESDDLH